MFHKVIIVFCFLRLPHEKVRKWALVGEMSQTVNTGVCSFNTVHRERPYPFTASDPRLPKIMIGCDQSPILYVFLNQGIDPLK